MNTEQPVTPNTGSPDLTPALPTAPVKKPKTLKVAAILLVVLVVLSAGLGIARNFGWLGLAGGGGVIVSGRPRDGFPGAENGQQPLMFQGTPGADMQIIQPGQGMQNLPTLQPGQEMPGFQGSTGTRTGVRTMPGGASFTILRYLQPISLYLSLGLLVLGIAAAVGTWKGRKWGVITAVITAALVMLASLPNLLVSRFALNSWLTIAEPVVRFGLGVAIIVLALLPASRRATGNGRPKERVVV